jgi:hypothetical protein
MIGGGCGTNCAGHNTCAAVGWRWHCYAVKGCDRAVYTTFLCISGLVVGGVGSSAVLWWQLYGSVIAVAIVARLVEAVGVPRGACHDIETNTILC